MRYLIPLAVLAGFGLWLTRAPSATPDHDADAAIALALATYRPAPVTPDESDEPDEADTPYEVPTMSAPKAIAALSTKAEIPPCGCGCMQTGQCKCENCCKRTADPQWQLDHPTAAKIAPGRWHTDYATAKREAESAERPMLVVFRDKDCVWCDRFELVLTDPIISQALKPFVCVRLNAGAYPSAEFAVKSFPTYVISNAAGDIVHVHPGYSDGGVLREMLGDAVRAKTAAAPIVSAPVVIAPVSACGPGGCASGSCGAGGCSSCGAGRGLFRHR